MSYPRLTKCMPDETRPNPFALLHKALRFGHCRMLSELGAQDFGQDAVAGRLLPHLVEQMELCRAVAEARQQALVKALGARGLEVDASACQDHAGHLTALAELQSLVRAVNVAAPQRRRPAARSIYRCYALYTSSDMARMDDDETMLLSSLHERLSDDELRNLEGRTFAALDPERVLALLQLMLPALSSAELELLLGVLRRHLDPVFFETQVEPVVRRLLAGGSSAAA